MDQLEDALVETLVENNIRENRYGYYHPSAISGCPLKTHLDWMTDNSATLNSWLFQGSAVHYYLEKTGLLRDALSKAGYHPVYTNFEVSVTDEVAPGIHITGRADAVTDDEESKTIFDVKYSSLSASYDHGRIYKYMAQVNTYAHLLGADRYALIMINSRSNELANDIGVLEGELSEDNYQVVIEKAKSIHEALDEQGYPEGRRFEPELLEPDDRAVNRPLDFIERSQCPSYDEECKYCDHKEYCPVYQGEAGGVSSFRGGMN